MVILIQPFSTRYLRWLPNKSGIIEPDIKQPDLQPIVGDLVDQLVGVSGDGLLVKEHEQPIEPLRCDAVRLRVEGEQDMLLFSPAGRLVVGAARG